MRAGVEGAAKLSATLKGIGRVPTQETRRAAREAALMPILQDAQQNLIANGSVVTGKLLRSMAIASSSSESRLGQRGEQPVGQLIEFGTAAHYQPNYRGGWLHPGATPKPFMRPAFDANTTKAIRAYADHMWRAMVRTIR